MTRPAHDTRASRHVSGNQGFTLVEMLAVLFILTLTATVALPSMRSPPDRLEIEIAARRSAAALRLAHSRAIAGNRDVLARIDVDERLIALDAEAGASMPAGIIMTITAARPERTGASKAGIRFFADGTSTGGEIVLTRNGRHAHIIVNWLTSAVRVELKASEDP